MEHGYKITTKYETHDPEKVDKILDQIELFGDLMNMSYFLKKYDF